MSKKAAKKGIESLEKQIEVHVQKLKNAQKNGDVGLSNYYEKEVEHFERAKENLARRIASKSKRKK